MADGNSPAREKDEDLITTFTEATSSSREEAELYLESHGWDIDAAVYTFTEDQIAESNPSHEQNLGIDESPLRLRSRSPSPPNAARYPLRLTAANIRRAILGTDSDSDENKENNGGGDQSGTMVQDHHPKEADVISLRDIVSAEPGQPHVMITHSITLWKNGFTLNNGPLDNQDDATFLQVIRGLVPSQGNSNTCIRVKLISRQEQDYPESPQPFTPFQGVGRIQDESDSVPAKPQASSVSLMVDPALPQTSIRIRLADGTRIVSQFNTYQTVRDIRGFIDKSIPSGSRGYLLLMGFSPKPLPNLDQTIQNAGIANSVLIQKF